MSRFRLTEKARVSTGALGLATLMSLDHGVQPGPKRQSDRQWHRGYRNRWRWTK